ncbi:unnamed protein product [Pylaiella littoralis]
MHNAIAKCGVLKKKAGMLRRKESRFYVLTNMGGIFQAKGFAAEFESLKPLLPLNYSSEVTLERTGPGKLSRDSNYVLRVQTKGQKGPPMEFEAASDAETRNWSVVMQDVIELIRVVNGDQIAAQPRPIMGIRAGDEGWYEEPTSRMALYTLNSDRMWVVRDRRAYDEATVLNWIASDSAQGSSVTGGYPTLLGGIAAISGVSLEQGSVLPDYPRNAPADPGLAPPTVPQPDYPVQSSNVQRTRGGNAVAMSQGGGGGGSGGGAGTWATSAPVVGSSSSVSQSSSGGGGGGGGSRNGSPDSRGRTVGGVMIGGSRNGSSNISGGGGGGSGGGGMSGVGVALAPPLPVLPSTFTIEKVDGEGFGGDADSLVLRRPSECLASSVSVGGSGGDGGGGIEEAAAAAAAGAAGAGAAGAATTTFGRMGRGGRWRGGGGGGDGGAAAAAAERRQAGCEGARRPLRLSPAMEILQSSLIKS